MDVSKLLKSVNNLNDYIRVTEEIATNYKNYKIQLNMSTVLALKKILYLEIEFFNKCEGNGAAVKIFGLMLLLPPSKTWSLFGRELVSLLQYWLNAIRKHLIIHNDNWWSFFQVLLQFIKEIRLKDSYLNNILVEEIAECLLDLATHSRAELSQRHKIICLFNLCGTDCSREIRFALRKQLDCYFIKLSTLLSSCGDVALQYSIVETLLRWLLPRHDQAVRLEAAAKWFPDQLYDRKPVNLFLKRTWENFFKDARDFLNAHNSSGNLITSVICKKLTIGTIPLITGSERRESWLDMNFTTKCISVVLYPRLLDMLQIKYQAAAYETLVISEANTSEAKLHKDASDVIISVATIEPPQVIPSSIPLKEEGNVDLKIVISSKNDMVRVDKSLRGIFADKFQVLFDVGSAIPLSPSDKNDSRSERNSDDDTRFSHSVEPQRARYAGFSIKPRKIGPLASPSTASTSSLAQLHDKLAALPRYNYDKEPISICAIPQLSNVTEVSETDDRHNINTSTSTPKLRPYGVCQKNSFQKLNKVVQFNKERIQQLRKPTYLTPAEIQKENSVSCLLVATIGSDESVINDTLERLPKHKDCNTDNVLDLLVQEAFHAKILKDKKCKTLISEPNFQEAENVANKGTSKDRGTTKKSCTVISNSTSTEESNTGFVENTQFSNINFDNRKLRCKEIQSSKQEFEQPPTKTFDEKVVEEFFSQHFAKNIHTDLVINPSLAKINNESSSDSSEDLEECYIKEVMDINEQQFIPDTEVVECLRTMVDKICKDFDKCTKTLNEDSEITNIIFGQTENTSANIRDISKKPKGKNINPGNIKLRFKSKKSKRAPKQTDKLELDRLSNESSSKVKDTKILEECTNDITSINFVKRKIINDYEIDIPLARRKRKLYSPKDERCSENWNDEESNAEVVHKVKTYPTTKSCYKEIEKERNEYKNKLRNRKLLKSNDILPSPKTKKINDAFDKLKNDIDSNERIVLVDRTNLNNDVAIYNFSSDSEDDDFKETTIKPRSSVKNRDNTITIKKDNINKKPKPKRKIVNQSKLKHKIEKPITLIDERMRETDPDFLNTSLEIQKSPGVNVIHEPKPKLIIDHQMEAISEECNESKKVNKKQKKNLKTLSVNKGKQLNKAKKSIILKETTDKTESPLPGLVVEMMPHRVDTINDSVTSMMLQKFKDIYDERPNIVHNEFNTTQNLLSEIGETNASDNSTRILITTKDKNVNQSSNNHLHTTEQSSSKQKPSTIIRVTKKQRKNSDESKKLLTHKIDNQKGTSSKTNLRGSVTSSNEIINITGNTEILSEKSIKTIVCSITAHGDLDLCENDLPPSQDLLNKSIEPRNLEVDDLNQSIKDFFIQLNKDILEGSQDKHDKLKMCHSLSIKSTHNLVEDKSSSKSTDIKIPMVSVTRLSPKDITKWLPSNHNSDSSSNHSSVGSANRKMGRTSNVIVEIHKNKVKKNIPKVFSTELRSSQISPIKLFVDRKPITRQNSSSPISNDDLEYRRNFVYTNKCSPINVIQKPKIVNSSLNDCDKDSSQEMRSEESKSTLKKTSIVSKRSAVKRLSSPFQSTQDSKKRKIEANNDSQIISNSVPSTSSVNDWLKQIKTPSRVQKLDFGFKNNMLNIVEKLDTTLVEIHHNTNKKFINMFVEAQKQLNELKEQRRSLYKQTAAELLGDMVKLIDVRFSALDKRSQGMDEQFMIDLKEKARILINDDCRQKRAMVTLLREDTQAVIDFINKGE